MQGSHDIMVKCTVAIFIPSEDLESTRTLPAPGHRWTLSCQRAFPVMHGAFHSLRARAIMSITLTKVIQMTVGRVYGG